MTTGIGIEANDGIVVLFDTQLNFEDEKKHTNDKQLTSKVSYGKNWAMGIAGTLNKNTSKLYETMEDKESSEVIEKWMKNYFDYQKAPRKYEGIVFPEVNVTNAMSMRNEEDFSLDDTAEYIFGIKYDKEPNTGFYLIHMDEFGNPKRLNETLNVRYSVIGSGKEDAVKYIDKTIAKSSKEYRKITLKQAFQLAYDALLEAGDSFSNQIPEPITIDKNGTQNHGELIKKKMDKAKEEGIAEIIKKLSGP